MQEKDDVISRQMALHIITGYKGVVDKSVAKRLLTQLPSAQPDLILCRECEKKEVCRFYDTQGDYGYCRYGKKDGQINPQYFDLEMRGD